MFVWNFEAKPPVNIEIMKTRRAVHAITNVARRPQCPHHRATLRWERAQEGVKRTRNTYRHFAVVVDTKDSREKGRLETLHSAACSIDVRLAVHNYRFRMAFQRSPQRTKMMVLVV